MAWSSFESFFQQATSNHPYPYQAVLAEHLRLPKALVVPTGAGKTAAFTLGWIWRRRFHPDRNVREQTPRRLIYCLPMRILVEQTRTSIESFLGRLGLTGPNAPQVHVLMGGESDDDWQLYPETDTILIGTLDMLLSRALNRGFGLSRFRWPQAFGLLHSDALWVCDEVQLFGAGLPTTTQLQAFREALGAYGPHHTLWMSATLQADWLRTVNHPVPSPDEILGLTPIDLENPELHRRLVAPKTLQLLPTKGVQDRNYAKTIASAVLQQHAPGSLTLVIVNTVHRAKEIFTALQGAPADLVLIHSRFRPPDRETQIKKLSEPVPTDGRIVVSTQVVEAGVDISARTIFTELSPWASFVQRLGRCNRDGKLSAAPVFLIDVDDKQAAPYNPADLQQTREILLARLGSSVSPQDVPKVQMRVEPAEVIRHRDLVDLFDTAADLSGNDLDVSRFIRTGDDHDIQVFWRSWEPETQPAPDEPAPHRSELCPVPIGEMRRCLENKHRAWTWDHLADGKGRWQPVEGRRLRPGMTVLLRAEDGGYDPRHGWDPQSAAYVTPNAPPDPKRAEAAGDDRRSFAAWQTIAEHTDQVVEVLGSVLETTDLSPDMREALLLAARWHDAGKAHPVFQQTMLKGLSETEQVERAAKVWAKTEGKSRRHSRPHFRHELASALALLQWAAQDPAEGISLAAYLTAAHHGRVRVSVRSLPGERRPTDEGRPVSTRFAMGVWDDDPLREAELGGGVQMPAMTLDLTPLEMGDGPNGERCWMDRAMALRDAKQIGPFRLAFLEALLRAADARASSQKGGSR